MQKKLQLFTALLSTATAACAVDITHVPQLNETTEQRDARMAWFREGKFGMFIHWGPCTIGDREIGWGRRANRPWDINGVQTPRGEDAEYDSYYKRFNPTKFDADAWAKTAKAAGMKYMVLIAKHHDGFCQFDSKLTDHDIMSSPYGKDIVKQFVQACRKNGLKVGLYYSTRDWWHPDYLVGDNAKYDAYYRGQIEELLSNYGKIDMLWFDHVGGQDWGKWKFDELFSMIYRLQPGILVNNRAARFCGPRTPEDRGPTPEIAKITAGDFETPEQHIGEMNLKRDWESCMILSPTPQGDGWSYRSTGKTRSLDESLKMLVSTVSGGGNLLLNFGPDQLGEFRPEEAAIAKGMGQWLKKYGDSIYGTRGGPFINGRWGGSTNKGKKLYLHVFEWPSETLRLAALPQQVKSARLFGGDAVEFKQTPRGLDVMVPTARRVAPVTIIELELDRPIERGQQSAGQRSPFDDEATFGKVVSEKATFTISSPSQWDAPDDHAKLFSGARSERGFAFHTGDETNPWVKIDLGAVRSVTGVSIENRPGEQRTSGLILSISEDGQNWTKIWTAPDWQPTWHVPITSVQAGAAVPGRSARYLKMETKPQNPAPMLLQRVEVYAKGEAKMEAKTEAKTVAKAPWSLETMPQPVPAPPGSKTPADPKDFAEVKMDFPIANGPFEPTWESIKQNYPGAPAWFRDAKFGVFIHWGPQASGRSGDWYARNLYRQGGAPYENHLKNFGHPAEFGYKDVLNAWKAPEWDAAKLTQAFYDAGMRFVMAVGVHHDNYDLWDSKYQPWNSVNVGPKKDMIGAWQKEAKARGMKFGITFHHEYTWWWWADAYGSDKTGPKAGVPYDANLTKADGKGKWWDGLDPKYLYGVDMREYAGITEIAFGRQGIFQDHQEYGKWYAQWWARRIQDAIEKYDPDLFYTDGNAPEPFSGTHSGSGMKNDAGRRVVAHYYNRSLAKRGKVDTIAFIKFQAGNPAIGMTSEVGVPRNIKLDQPWIGENPIGDWYYGPNYYYDAINLVRSLLEYTSRDGNYACAVPVTPEGGLEPACLQMLQDMGAWMKVNGEGIYGSRAWKKWGEGEGASPKVFSGKLGKATAEMKFSNADFRFTQGRDGSVYAWCLNVPAPGETLTIKALGRDAKLLDKPIQSVKLLGSDAVIEWTQNADDLTLKCPAAMPFRYAVGFKIVAG